MWSEAGPQNIERLTGQILRMILAVQFMIRIEYTDTNSSVNYSLTNATEVAAKLNLLRKVMND